MNQKIHVRGKNSRNKIRKEKETQVLCMPVTKKFHVKMSISECFLLLPFTATKTDHLSPIAGSHVAKGEEQLRPPHGKWYENSVGHM